MGLILSLFFLKWRFYSLSVFAGFCYGSNFTPPQWVMKHLPNASQSGLDYVFSHFSTPIFSAMLNCVFSLFFVVGIFLMSTFLLLAYSILMKNNPRIYPNIIIPVFGS